MDLYHRRKVTATFSRDCLLHLSFVVVTSMIISLTRINHVQHHCQPEGNSNWAPNRKLFDAPEKQDDITQSVDVVMLDGPTMLCVLKPAASGTLREYACQDVFLPYVEHQLGKVHRIDVVWDNHRPVFLKAQTRNMRGK